MSNDVILYVHGRGDLADEAAHYAPLFPGCQVMGLDYRGRTTEEAGPEVAEAVRTLAAEGKRVILIANSVGAWYVMCAGIDGLVKKAYFISPVVDMEKLICDLLTRAGATEDQLRSQGVVHTSIGEDLHWDYLCHVRAHPIQWTVPTAILCGSRDSLTSYETYAAFARRHGAALTVMEGGQHWFHTPEQMAFLDEWIKRSEANG